jgi:hypothetical protein
MSAINPNVGRALFRVACDPTGGDLPDLQRACRALAREPQLVTAPKPFTCFGGPSSWWDVTISGTLGGQAVNDSFSTCWTRQMRTIGELGLGPDVLKEHLLPRRTETVEPGTTRLIPPGILEPGDLVACDILGHHLEVGVPDAVLPPGQRSSEGYGGASVRGVDLSIRRAEDGSVEATCGEVGE